MSTWPTTPIDTSGLDGDLDHPPRDAFLAMAQALNAMIAAGAGGSLVRVQRWTTPGTYTFSRHPDTKWLIAELQGAGGRGMRPNNSAGAGTSAFGGAGGAGAYVRALFLADFETAELVVGNYATPAVGWDGSNGQSVLRGGWTRFQVVANTRFAQADGGGGGRMGAASSVVPRVDQVFGTAASQGQLVSSNTNDVLLLSVLGASAEACVVYANSLVRIGGPGAPYGAPAAGDEVVGVSGPGRASVLPGSGGRGYYAAAGSASTADAELMTVGGAATIWELG